MTKKMTWLSVLVMILAMVFSACDSTQEVEGDVGIADKKPLMVAAVTVTKTTNNQYYIVTWDAAAEDVDYEVLWKKEGTKASGEFNVGDISGFTSRNKYDPATGEQIPNDNFDKLSARVSSMGVRTAGNYLIGVRSFFRNEETESKGSDVKWSEPFAITAGPKVAAVTVKQTTDKKHIIVSWDAVEGATDEYRFRITGPTGGMSYSIYDNDTAYDEADGKPKANDTDKYYAIMNDVQNNPGTYYFGVNAEAETTDISVVTSITWSDTITVAAP